MNIDLLKTPFVYLPTQLVWHPTKNNIFKPFFEIIVKNILKLTCVQTAITVQRLEKHVEIKCTKAAINLV